MKKVTSPLLFTAILFSPVAFAGGTGEQGVYAGLTAGQGAPGIAAVAGTTLNKKSSAVYGGLLGYKFNKNVAIEGQLTGLGKVTSTTGTAKADAFGVSAVGMLPMNDRFGVYGKLGYARTKTSTSGAFGANGASRTAPSYGLGMQYNVNPMVGIRLGWDRFGVATASIPTGTKVKANADVTSLGIVFNF